MHSVEIESNEITRADPVGVTLQVSSSLQQIKEVIQQIVTQEIITASGANPWDDKRVYESNDVVRSYVAKSNLQEPEATVLNELRNRLPNMRMLDIGVGAGRTTQHFAELVKEYIGIDYSSTMIEACRLKFPKYRFEVADARNLSIFDDAYFDFILFSFNGIDLMDEERMAILREIRRLIRTGGYFCFSTHNLNSLAQKCSIQLSKHPTVLALRVYRLLQMRLLNKRETWSIIRNPSRNQQHLIVNIITHPEGRVKIYYITPVEQLKQLSELGFSDTKMYGLRDGREIKNPIRAVDSWVYFQSKAP